jgi:putative transposase
MNMKELQSLYHCVYALSYHLVLVTKYRRKALTSPMLEALEGWIRTILEEKWHGALIEFGGEADHVHLLLQLPPSMEPAKAVNALKTATSRRLRNTFSHECARWYRGPVFWSRSYCILTAGGAPLALLQQYIQNQDRPE